MDKTQALQNLLNGTATEDEINLLKGGLASGEISIGGNVNQSVIIIGSGNTVELSPAALDRLGGRSLLGDLDRDLTGDEIAAGLNRLEAELPIRAPILLTQFQEQTRRLRPSLKTNPKSLSDHAHRERVEALAQVNSLCMEALDISFNALCLGEEPPEYDPRSPFRGLESFRPEDSEFFFGREALTKKLVGKINSHPFLAVLGASGSGKSSLVMAGLIPALGSNHVIFRPGTNPLEALETVKENTLVVVDQFEELFTLTRDDVLRKEFIARLFETIGHNKVIITLRSDFLGEVAKYRTLNDEVQNHLENVPPMDLDELRRAMEGQAGVVGLCFEADLSQQILDDVAGEPGAMPLLQHALWELWNRRHGRNLRASEYRAFGGVKQAITNTAEKVYGECIKAEQEQLRDIFLRLTRLDDSDERRDTRRRIPLSGLIPSEHDIASITLLLDKLANARLIVKTVYDDKTEIEIAHEALIRHWSRLIVWLNEDRDYLRLREGVSEDAREWENSGRDASLLNHRGARLEMALAINKKASSRLNTSEQNYLNACEFLRVKEQKEKYLRRAVVASIIILALISISVITTMGLTGQLSRLIYRPLDIVWVEIPAGDFLMGSSDKEILAVQQACPSCDVRNEQPVHKVYLDAYSIGKYEITNQQYNQCVKAGLCNRPANNLYATDEFASYPVTHVAWKDGLAFCEWNGGSLPSEAQWEKAARGSSIEPSAGLTYPWGDTWDATRANADIGNNGSVMKVGSFSPLSDGEYGVADMSGNVWEWVSDWYKADYYTASPARNPTGPESGNYKVLRGGSFANSSIDARSTYRTYYDLGNVSNDLGFRCVK